MKKFFLRFVAIFAISMASLMSADAQIIIKVRPGPPIVKVRPIAPGPRHVWVSGEYVWEGGTYVYRDGYWALPPARVRGWREGHWKKRPGGWVWVAGHWAR